MKRKISLFLKILLFISLSIFFCWLVFLRFFILDQYSYMWEEYLYLWLLFTLIYIIWSFNISSKRILGYSIFAYLMGVFLLLLNSENFAEIFMRSSFIGFITGIIKAFIEYRKDI